MQQSEIAKSQQSEDYTSAYKTLLSQDNPFPTMFSNFRNNIYLTQEDYASSFDFLKVEDIQENEDIQVVEVSEEQNDFMMMSQSDETTKTENTMSFIERRADILKVKYQNAIGNLKEKMPSQTDESSNNEESFILKEPQVFNVRPLNSYLNETSPSQGSTKIQCKIEIPENKLHHFVNYAQQQSPNKQMMCEQYNSKMVTEPERSSIHSISTQSFIFSPKTQKLKMLQIQKKICSEDSDQSFLNNHQSVNTQSRVSEGSFNLVDMKMQINKIEEEQNQIGRPSKSLFDQKLQQHDEEMIEMIMVDNTSSDEEISVADFNDKGIDNIDDSSSSDESQAGDSQSRTTMFSTQSKTQQLMLNLESILLLENLLSQLQSQFKSNSSQNTLNGKMLDLCETWWEIVRLDPKLFEVNQIFKDETIKRSLKNSLVLQMVAISLIGYLHAQDVDTQFKLQLRNLINYVNSNYLILIHYIIEKFPAETLTINVWGCALQELVMNKAQKKIPKNKRTQLLQQNLDFMMNLIKSILFKCNQERQKFQLDHTRKAIFQHQIFPAMGDVMKGLDKLSFDECKQMIGNSLRQGFEQESQRPSINLITARLEQKFVAPQIEEPFLKSPTDKKYTLVLDLDETLLHYQEIDEKQGYLHIRPGTDEFLEELSKHFELVIFTAGTQDYAEWAIQHIQNNKQIEHKLYRQHTIFHEGFYVKDLSRIGRDITRTIIVDNTAENFQLQPDNGVFIKSFFDDENDTALFELAPLLIAIAQSDIEDVRQALFLIRNHMMESIARGIQNPTLHLISNIKQILQQSQ